MFLTDLGEVYGCGNNINYQIKPSGSIIVRPTIIPENDFNPPTFTDKIIQISCGIHHTMFLTDLGKAMGVVRIIIIN